MSQSKSRLFSDRRTRQRHAIKLDVNYRHGETYLFCRSSNLSELGIYLISDAPLSVGTAIELSFKSPDGTENIDVDGEIVWVKQESDHTGMGVRFTNLPDHVKARIKSIIRTIAYLE